MRHFVPYLNLQGLSVNPLIDHIHTSDLKVIELVFILNSTELINVKVPTIVGIFTFMSRLNATSESSKE